MEDEELEKYFEKLLDKFDDFMFMDSSGLEGTEIIKQQIKEILEKIIENNQTTWTIHYPKNMKRG